MKKKLLFFAAVVVALISIACLSVSAATTVASGTCGADGDNLTWVLDDTGTLTISGEGAMADWTSLSDTPWYNYRSSIKTVVIKDGVTSIGGMAFSSCESLTSIKYLNNEDAWKNVSKGTNWKPDSAIVYFAKTDPDSAIVQFARTVTFKDWDGSVISEKEYYEGDTVAAPADPTRAADEGCIYTFAGWEYDGDATYTATYTANKLKEYTIEYIDWDGTVILTTKSDPDSEWGPWEPIPKRESDETYTYTFAGWEKRVLDTGDVVYTATYTSAYIDYTVKFVDWNGMVISENTHHYGDTITVPADPTRETDSIGTHTFAGWGKEVSSVCTESTVYTATYNTVYFEYTIKFYNYDGSLIESRSYHWGDEIVVPSATRNADETYTYDFSGWDKEIVPCAGDASYTAQFAPVYINYNVVFKDWDGTVLHSGEYHYNDIVTIPDDPTRAADNTYTYAFAGWGNEVSSVCKGNVTYTATYDATYIEYTVTFYDYNESVISSSTYHFGDAIAVPDTPTRSPDGTYIYVFSDWGKEVSLVCNGNATYTAAYTPVLSPSQGSGAYVITFKDHDNSSISTKTYGWGDTVTAPIAPTRENDSLYTYTFIGWDKEITACYGDTVYTAVYKAVPLENAPQITFESVRIVNKAHFEVKVYIKNNPGIASLIITPDFPDEFVVHSVKNGNVFSDVEFGKYQYVWSDGENNTTDGLLMTIVFDIPKLTATGDYDLSFKLRGCYNYDENDVGIAISTTSVKVVDYVYGDVNNDGNIDGKDLVRLKKYIADYNYDTGESSFKVSLGADANGDGVIDGKDLVRLKKYIAAFDYDTGTSDVVLGPAA